MEIHKRLSDPATVLPLQLAVIREAESVAGTSSTSLRMSLRDIASHIPDILQINDNEAPDTAGTITIRSESVTISIRSLLTSTVHYPDPWPGDPDPELVLKDAMVMLGVMVNRLGRFDASARLLSDYALGSSVIQSDDVLARVTGALIRTHRIVDALRILEGLAGTDAFDKMLAAMSAHWIGMTDTLTEQEREAVVEFLARQAELDEARGETGPAAISHYNLANRLRVFGRQDRAIEHYLRAAELDPRYEERSYFSGDMAGSLFESGRFEEAVSRYRQAVSGGGRERYLPLLADALLFAGHYEEASKVLAQVLQEATASPNPSEWSLKHLIAREIVGHVSTEQARDEDRALSLASLESEVSTVEARERLMDALMADAICPLAWFNLALVELQEGRTESAYTAFVATAIIARSDLFAFAMAILLGRELDDPRVGDVVRTAYFLHGARFLGYLATQIGGLSSEERAELLESIDLVLASSGPSAVDRTVEFRVLREDGTYESMEINLD